MFFELLKLKNTQIFLGVKFYLGSQKGGFYLFLFFCYNIQKIDAGGAYFKLRVPAISGERRETP